MSSNLEICMTTAVISGICLVTYTFLKYHRKKTNAENLPPSLPSIPFFGSLLFLPRLEKMHIFLMKKSEELGPIFSGEFGEKYTVFISGKSTIYEAFVKQSTTFASRPYLYSFYFLNPKQKGILNHSYNSEFRKYHQLSLNILKNFGLGQGIMENRIILEVEDLVEHTRKLKSASFCPDSLITGSVSNVIQNILFGERYEHTDPILQKLIDNSHELLQDFKDILFVNFFPKLRFLPKYRRCLKHCVKVQDDIFEFLSNRIEAGLRHEIPESFVSHFLHMEGPEFDRTELLYILRDLILAGTETTSSTLLWALALIANHGDVQRRLHKEIDSVVAKNKLPSLDDRKNLPYVESVILELMRLKTVVPLGLAHETLKDTFLNGYFIPRGSTVAANLYGTHMDAREWTEPTVFNPERFLDTDGNIVKRDAIVPFSLGKRSCLGETLARQEIFLFLAGLLQNFEILPAKDQQEVPCVDVFSLTLAPADYLIRLIPRFT